MHEKQFIVVISAALGTQRTNGHVECCIVLNKCRSRFVLISSSCISVSILLKQAWLSAL